MFRCGHLVDLRGKFVRLRHRTVWLLHGAQAAAALRLASSRSRMPFAHQREDVSAVIDGIVIIVIAADRDQIAAEIDVIENGVCDGTGRSNKRRRRAACIGRGHGGVPERPVMHIAAFGDIEKPLGADIGCCRRIERTAGETFWRLAFNWSSTRCAFSQARSSVSATMGRKVTQMRGRSVRPAFAASA